MFALRRLIPILLAGATVAAEPLRMGPEWFARLRDPATRIEALREYENKKYDGEIHHDDPEEFASTHRRTLVFPCPQPGLPDAWAVLTLRDWRASREILTGREPGSYPPHPLELERCRRWDAEFDPSKPGFRLWKPGQPWFEGISGALVDPGGTELDSGFFASPAVIADFDGDGMLDLLEVERHHVLTKAKEESLIDCLEIGSLANGSTRGARLYCNLRAKISDPRPWRFAVRAAPDGGLRLALVSTAEDAAEIVFRFADGDLLPATDPLPEGILLDQDPETGDWNSPKATLEKHELALKGIGSDSAKDIEAGRPDPPAWNSFEGREWTLPETGGLPPRDAALAMVREQFDPAFLQHYDLATVGDPVPLPTRGWLEQWCDGGGWADEFVVVWWLKEDSAERWTETYGTSFLVSTVDRKEAARRIAITHEFDHIRSVPKSPFAPEDAHDSMGGDDIPIYRVRALSSSPELARTVFDSCTPSLWKWVGSRYDRELAAVIATHFAGPTPEDGEPRDIRDLAPLWLDPEQVDTVPPGLSRAAVRAIGKNRWHGLKPLLTRLQTSFGPPGEGERRFAEILRLIGTHREDYKVNGKAEWMAERELRSLQRERIELATRLAGDPAFELRDAVEKALVALDATGDEE